MNKLKQRIQNLGLSYKKEMTIFLVCNVTIFILGISLFILTKLWYVLLIFLGGLLAFILFFFNRYSLKERKEKEDLDNEFVTLMTYFQIFITNHFNVYSSLIKLEPFASNIMKDILNKLVKSIDDDKSVKPFIEFSKHFSIPIIENVMISVYQMVDEGENNERLRQFDFLFSKMSEQFKANLSSKKQRQIDSLSTFPLIGAGMITILLTFGIIAILGEFINVL